ncbi:MAG TPA: zinc ribbon domain-containing protein [Mycobacteriales bacterium]|nr:zinc ribbon domain-containing protein [Mycobacteriales bacterium]
MASYDYRCRTCDVRFEVVRGISEDADAVSCPSGHADVARIWSAVAVMGRSGGASASAPVMSGGGGCCGGGCGCG